MVLALTARNGRAGDVLDLGDAGRARLVTLSEVPAGPAGVALAALQSLQGFDGSTLPQVLTLAAAGHAAGMWLVTPYGRVRTIATSGQITLTLGWTDPNAGVQTFSLGGFNVATLGTFALASRGIVSNGTGAITLTIAVSIAIVGGPPVLDAWASATQVAA